VTTTTVDSSPTRPPALGAGDRVALIAPASPYDRDEFAAGVRRLEDRGFEVGAVGEHRPAGHLVAARAHQRLDELHAALADPEVKAILAIRGGYGVMHLLGRVDWSLAAAQPKLLVGLSDITPLLNGVFERVGVTTLHGPVVVGLGGRTDDRSVDRLFEAMTVAEPLPPLDADGGTEEYCLSPGQARGRICGGNLSLIAATAGTPFQLRTSGRILLLEDVGEPPYRIDRLLTQLRLAGMLQAAAAIGFGEMVGCEAPEGVPYRLRDVVRDAVADLPLPVLGGLPFGHGSRNWAFPIGARASLDAEAGTVAFHEPVVDPRE